LGGNQQQVKLWFEVTVSIKVWSIEYLYIWMLNVFLLCGD
jgi:hypothetical protein